VGINVVEVVKLNLQPFSPFQWMGLQVQWDLSAVEIRPGAPKNLSVIVRPDNRAGI
jgi:hypothetical protein